MRPFFSSVCESIALTSAHGSVFNSWHYCNLQKSFSMLKLKSVKIYPGLWYCIGSKVTMKKVQRESQVPKVTKSKSHTHTVQHMFSGSFCTYVDIDRNLTDMTEVRSMSDQIKSIFVSPFLHINVMFMAQNILRISKDICFQLRYLQLPIIANKMTLCLFYYILL